MEEDIERGQIGPRILGLSWRANARPLLGRWVQVVRQVTNGGGALLAKLIVDFNAYGA